MISKRPGAAAPLGRLALVAALALASFIVARPAAAEMNMIGNCDVTGDKGLYPPDPGQARPDHRRGQSAGARLVERRYARIIKDGYEYCMAANIAYRAGLDKVQVVNVAWDALVAGQTKDFDFALSEISITDERKKVVDFSVPYFHSDIGVLVKKGTEVDSAKMKEMRIGVQQATTGADFVAKKLKPTPGEGLPRYPQHVHRARRPARSTPP